MHRTESSKKTIVSTYSILNGKCDKNKNNQTNTIQREQNYKWVDSIVCRMCMHTSHRREYGKTYAYIQQER